jgi:hypothetical protein
MAAARTVLLLVLGLARMAAAAPVPIVAAGDASPLGLPFSRFSDAALDDRGRVTFVGAATAVFRDSGGSTLAHVVGPSDVVAGRIVAGVGAADVDGAGCVAFRAVFVDGGAGVYRRCAETLTTVAESGSPAPGGGTLAGLGTDLAAGAGGRTAFNALLADGTTALYVADGAGNVGEVARTGGPSPAGGVFTGLRLVGLSSSGRVGFRGVVSGGRNGLFFSDAGTLVALAVEGEATPVGGSFTSIGLAALNDADQWAFRATTSLAAAAGVFRADAAQAVPFIEAVALEGETTPVGGTFKLFPSSLVPAINRTGAIAFRAALDSAPYTSAVFVATPDRSLGVAVGVGEATEVGQLARLRELALGDDGGVLVRASLAGGVSGIFRARSGIVDAVARLGDPTDLGGGFRFGDVRVRGASGEAIFLGVKEGVFVATAPGALTTIAVLGGPTPLGGTYGAFDPPAAGTRGRIVFGASIQGGRANEALLAVGRSRAVPLVTTGSRAPGGGRLLDLFSDPIDGLARPGVGRGAVAFQAGLAGTSAESGLFAWTGGRLRALALAGDTAPGGRFTTFGTPALRAARDVAFVAQVAGPNDSILYRRRGRRTRAVAVAGRETGTRLGGRFTAFDAPAVSPTGIVFRATLDQGSREALFLTRGRSLEALVASGEDEPGGGRFRSFAAPAASGASVVFRAALAATASTSALFRADPAEPPTLTALARAGEPSPLAGTYLGFGAPSGNRQGAVAFVADLTRARAASAVFLDRPE